VAGTVGEPAVSLESARAARWAAAERLWLPADEGVATVQAMRSSRPPREPRADRQRRARARRRVRRLAGAAVLAAVLLITLLVTAFSSRSHRVVPTAAPAPANRLLPAGPPSPLAIAVHGGLHILMPVPQERLTAIGYYASGDGALPLSPLGSEANQGFVSRTIHSVFGGGRTDGLRYYELGGGSGPANTGLAVGAPVRTDVYAPVDGTVVGLTNYVVNGRKFGMRIDIQPASSPSFVLSLTQLAPDPSLRVGSTVSASTTKVGTILDLSRVEHQSLSRYTQDPGNHVTIELRRSATLSIP
jgi:murein DD-endopeptidase MepM/ murein hydrolase activator NlpD